jgi:IS5 family transposase
VTLPEEIKRREDRLAAIARAKSVIEARAAERFERQQAEFAVKQAAREAKAAASGKKPRGRPPEPPAAGPQSKDQVNLTDEDSRIMKASGDSFDQCYNAQAAVDSESMLIVALHVTQAANDKQQVEPAIKALQALPEGLQPDRLLADTGYFSARNVEACETAGIEPLIATARDDHHPAWRERFQEPGQGADSELPERGVERMRHTLKTQAGRAAYALRKQTVEPVFGIIKSVMGFRQFLLRGVKQVRHEWTLVCLAWNLKRMAVLHPNSVRRA